MLKYGNYDKLMIVAHPDDEIIFGAATLLSDTKWKVICVTNGSYQLRRLEFQKVMGVIGCEYEMWDYVDDSYSYINQECETRIRDLIKKSKFSKIVTHNEYGEYNHRHHIQIHNVVNSVLGANFYVFCRGVELDLSIWRRKLKLMALYRSQSDMCHKLLDRARHESITKMI